MEKENHVYSSLKGNAGIPRGAEKHVGLGWKEPSQELAGYFQFPHHKLLHS